MGVQEDGEGLRRQVASDVGNTLRTARKEKGWSQRLLADLMTEVGFKWHQTTVGKTETGQRPIQVDELVMLASLLHLPAVDAMFGSESPIPKRLLANYVRHMQEQHEQMVAEMLKLLTEHGGREASDEFSRVLNAGEAKYDMELSELETDKARWRKVLEVMERSSAQAAAVITSLDGEEHDHGVDREA